MFDNQAGNNTRIEGVHNYCSLFCSLHTPYFKVIGNDKLKDSMAECMMAHQTEVYKQSNNVKRYFFVITTRQGTRVQRSF